VIKPAEPIFVPVIAPVVIPSLVPPVPPSIKHVATEAEHGN
jgi:hypothetical protein